ncbi:DNA/RNA non-specific endonuclease [Isoptericola sp. AK164]|uniref:DNA/RNA non-specific endonuclease n=1 Tax=Isoptericola sp. AK164 TaxID=3024246 RepID=UPI0024186503|nr:DNA/RNA non-specific endonuclease [Isoptericola sp. AK164]
MTGYDACFLDRDDRLRVPLPVPADGGPDPAELRRLDHPHFSVLLHSGRRLAVATACMIDGARLQPLARSGSWRLDPQAPPAEQADNDLYHHNVLDRGHLVRRLDPMWGTEEEARDAGEATFVYTNAAPQVDEFNQSKSLWNGLEDHVLAFADAHDHRVVVLTGCVFADADPVYRGVPLPRRFWKAAAWVTEVDGERVLRSAGFLLDQSPLLTDAELSTATGRALAVGNVPPLGPYRTFQVPVADLADLTGLDLGPLVGADVVPTERRALEPLAAAGPPSAGWTELSEPAAITLGPR